MIFLTVGSQMPFDRLIMAIDNWAATSNGRHDVLAQIGDTSFRPLHMRYEHAMPPDKFKTACAQADLIIGHAGMGTVLTACDLAKPLVILPRRGDRHETRNDHQLATARWLAKRAGIWVAWEADELPALIDQALAEAAHYALVPNVAEPRLIAALRTFILA